MTSQILGAMPPVYDYRPRYGYYHSSGIWNNPPYGRFYADGRRGTMIHYRFMGRFYSTFFVDNDTSGEQ